jgi:hypothetical protein
LSHSKSDFIFKSKICLPARTPNKLIRFSSFDKLL